MAQAKQHFETGRNAYNAGDYVTAIREFKAAEALRPSPILDYNIGLANEKLGKRRVAVKYYKRYLEEQPNASNKAEVEGKVTALEAEIARAAAARPPGTTAQPGQPGAQAGAAGRHAADRSERGHGAAGLRPVRGHGAAGPAGGGQAGQEEEPVVDLARRRRRRDASTSSLAVVI